MIALVTDSASQLPSELAAEFGILVAPIVVNIDGVEYREGIDLTADDFWAQVSHGDLPEITTSQPSPGTFSEIYQSAVEQGATDIVSVHIGTAYSGTINSARIAAEMVDVDVHVVDSGTASFGVSCCVWEAASAIAAGGSAPEVAVRARRIRPAIGTAFILGALDFARRGGRFSPELLNDSEQSERQGVAVLSGHGSDLKVVAQGHSVDELCDQIVACFLAENRPLRAGVCLADPATLVFTEGIEARLRAAPAPFEVELVRYRVGPSIAAHTGPGTAGGFWYCTED